MKMFNVIAEVGSNWNSSAKIGKKIIDLTKDAGANYVKFQMWRAKDLYNPSHPSWNEIKKSELSPAMIKEFKKHADKIGINLFCSVFYPEAVDHLEELGVNIYKVASITSALKHKFARETLEKINATKKPVIMSMGLGGNLNQLKKILKNNKLYLLYCISRYPTSLKSVDFVEMMKYDGFSDHTMGTSAPILFASLSQNSRKPLFLEKHISIKESKGPDKPFSMDVYDLKKLIYEFKQIHKLSNTIKTNH